MKLSSPAFEHNSLIPFKYSCEGQNINPPLKIDEIPEGTDSLVLVVSDPDAPSGTFIHWVMGNIPVMPVIPENAAPGEEGENSYGHQAYDGPCPPIGTHRYVFTLLALNRPIPSGQISADAVLTGSLNATEMGRASLIGLYQKQNKETE